MARKSTIQILRREGSTTADQSTTTLSKGELFWDQPTNRLYCGDGGTIKSLTDNKKYIADYTTLVGGGL